jgi:hypothetical protein
MESTLLATCVPTGFARFWRVLEFLDVQVFESLRLNPFATTACTARFKLRANPYFICQFHEEGLSLLERDATVSEPIQAGGAIRAQELKNIFEASF